MLNYNKKISSFLIILFITLLFSCNRMDSVDKTIYGVIDSLKENDRAMVEISMPFISGLNNSDYSLIRETFRPFFEGDFEINKEMKEGGDSYLVFISKDNSPEKTLMLFVVKGEETDWIISQNAHYKQTIDFMPLAQ